MSLPIPIFTTAVIYFTIWWIVLFAVLPWGVRSQAEDTEVSAGTDPGAPTAPRMLVKVVWTSLISALVMVVVLAMFAYLGG